MKQIEITGDGSLREMPGMLEMYSRGKIALFTGDSSFEKCGAESLINENKDGHEYRRFIVDSEQPDIEIIKNLIRGYKAFGAEAVVAIGGGNVIDTAKAVNFISAQSGDADECLHDPQKDPVKGKPLIAVPTTAGAGSEATHFAVVYSGEAKYSLAHSHILPDAVIIDPVLTYSMSPRQTAVSGIDVLCQSVESIWACASTDESLVFAEKALSLVIENLHKAVMNPDPGSRKNMALAANLAGKAINISRTTAPHAVSYTLTRKFNVPHGQAVSVTLGEFAEYNYDVSDSDCTDKRGASHVRNSIERIFSIIGVLNPAEAGEWFRKFSEKAGLAVSLRELGITTEEELEYIAQNTNAERLGNNPRKLSASSILEVLKKVF